MGNISLEAADLVIRVSKGAAIVIAGFGWAAAVMLVRVAVFVPTWKALHEFVAVFVLYIVAGSLALAWVLVKVIMMFVWRVVGKTTPPGCQKMNILSACARKISQNTAKGRWGSGYVR